MSELEQLKAENRQLLADVICEQQKRLEDIKKYLELRRAFLDALEFSYRAEDLDYQTGMPPERCREVEALYIKLSQER